MSEQIKPLFPDAMEYSKLEIALEQRCAELEAAMWEAVEAVHNGDYGTKLDELRKMPVIAALDRAVQDNAKYYGYV